MQHLEEQIAHLTRTVEDLNAVVTRRQDEIDRLTRRVEMLMRREGERAVLERWFEGLDAPRANWLDVILYSHAQLVLEAQDYAEGSARAMAPMPAWDGSHAPTSARRHTKPYYGQQMKGDAREDFGTSKIVVAD